MDKEGARAAGQQAGVAAPPLPLLCPRHHEAEGAVQGGVWPLFAAGRGFELVRLVAAQRHRQPRPGALRHLDAGRQPRRRSIQVAQVGGAVQDGQQRLERLLRQGGRGCEGSAGAGGRRQRQAAAAGVRRHVHVIEAQPCAWWPCRTAGPHTAAPVAQTWRREAARSPLAGLGCPGATSGERASLCSLARLLWGLGNRGTEGKGLIGLKTLVTIALAACDLWTVLQDAGQPNWYACSI